VGKSIWSNLLIFAIIASAVAVYAVNVIRTLAADLPQPDEVKLDIQEPSVVYDRNGIVIGYLGSSALTNTFLWKKWALW